MPSFYFKKATTSAEAHPERTSFQTELLRTQRFCQHLLQNPGSPDTAKRLRTLNLQVDGQPLFGFREIGNGACESTETVWNQRPEAMLEQLLRRRSETLRDYPLPEPQDSYDGRVVVVEFDISVFDGASDAESRGLFDVGDLPPIDTWFFLLLDGKSRFLCAWIPAPFKGLTQAAIDVNCFDCIGWMDERLPQLFEALHGRGGAV